MRIAEFHAANSHERDDFGFGVSHFSEPFRWEAEEMRLYATALNKEVTCIQVNAQQTGLPKEQQELADLSEGGCGNLWTVVWMTVKEFQTSPIATPEALSWLERAVTSFKSDRTASQNVTTRHLHGFNV